MGGRYPLGRESFLTPVDWPAGEWPRVHHPRLQFDREAVKSTAKWACLPGNPRFSDCYIRTPSPERYQWHDKIVRLRPINTTLAVAVGCASFVGKRQRSLNSTANTSIHVAEGNVRHPVLAGLAVYKDDFRSASIAIDFKRSPLTVQQRRVRDSDHSAEDLVLSQKSLTVRPGASVSLSIEASQERYEVR